MDNIAFTKLATETTLQLALPIDTLKAAFISSFVENCTSELSPVAAILGGVLAQDVINVLGKREQSLQNFLVFDGDTQAAPVICLCPEEVETREELGMLQRQQENGGANPATAAVVID